MNIAPHLAHAIAAGAILAAAMLVLLGSDDADQVGPIRALARAQSLVERQARISAIRGIEQPWRASRPVRVAEVTAIPARR